MAGLPGDVARLIAADYETRLECPFSRAGCTFKAANVEERKRHEKDNINEHLLRVLYRQQEELQAKDAQIVNLETQLEAMKKVGDLRKEFLEKYRDTIAKGDYDERDLKRLAEDDQYTCVFLTTVSVAGDLTKAMEAIDTVFKWRKTESVNDIEESSFSEELMKLAADTLCYHGEDNQGSPILYVAIAKNPAKTAEEVKELKRLITYRFDQHFRYTPERKCVVLLDMTGASISNLNIEIARFIIACMTQYYPSYLSYMINYQMPFLLSATWKVISAFLSAEQKKYIKFVKGKDLLNYINEEHMYPHMIEAAKK